ncbi:MAG: tetratricopeptide repeat protein [Pseudomonadota bacterium]
MESTLLASSSAIAQDELGGLGEPTPQEQIQALVESGLQQYNEGDFEAAVASFTQVINLPGFVNSPSYPQLALARAKAYAGLEEYEAALEDVGEALTYGQSNQALLPEIQNTRGEIYMDLGAYQQALPDLQAAAQANRQNPIYQFNVGKTLVKLGGGAQAEKPLTAFLDSDLAAELEEQRGEALALRGQAYVAMGKPEEANNDFEAALELDPANHEVYFGRASLAVQDEDYAAAVEPLRLAIENYTPENEDDELPFVQGYLTLAFVLEEVGKAEEDAAASRKAYESVLAVCDELLDALPENNPAAENTRAATLFRKGIAQRLLGDLIDAVKTLTQAIRINPGLGEAYFRRGICYFYLGEEKLAIRDFEQSAAINFDVPRASLWKGVAWARLGDYTEAIRAHGESLAVSDRYTPAYVNRALVQMQLGEYGKAVEDLNEAIRLEPTEPKHYYRRGRAYELLGETQDSIQSYMSAISFDERFVPAYSALIEVLTENGQRELAGVYRRRLAELGLNASL